MALDLSNLSAADAVAALRSYPRRYRATLAPIEGDDNLDAMAQRVGPEGVSALDLAGDTVRTLGLLSQALRQVLVHDDPVVHAGVVDPAERVWDEAVPLSIPSVLDELDHEAAALADAVARVGPDDWMRTAVVAGTGRAVTAIDIVREAVRTGSDNLHRIDVALRAARG